MARGFCQYAAYNTEDAWSPGRPFGLVTGVDAPDDPAAEHVEGIAGDDEIIGGPLKPEFSIDFLPCDADVIGYAFRNTSGYPCSAVPEWYAKLGVDRDYVFAGCKLSKLALSVEVGKPMSAKATVRAASRTPGTLAKPTMLARRKPFVWYRTSTITLNGESYTANGWDLTLDNEVEPDTDLDGGTTGALRLPKRNVEGNESVSLDFAVKAAIPESVLGTQDDDLPVDMAWTTTIASSLGDQITFTVTGLAQCKGDRRAHPGGATQVYRYRFEARRNSLAAGYVVAVP